MSKRGSIARRGILVALVLSVAGSAVAAEAVAVVVHHTRPGKNISRLDILAIFNGNALYWTDRSDINVFLPPASDLLANLVFYKFIGSSSSKLQVKWMQAISKGQARRPPVQPKDPKEALDRLSRTPTGIAVVSLSEVEAYPGAADLFTILTVDGRKAGDDGYPLNK